MEDRTLDFDTLAAQAGARVRVGDTISTVAPIDPSTTFTYDSIDGVHAALAADAQGFAYARNANPTVASLEEVLAALEGAEDAVAFASGMAVISAAIGAVELEPGDVIVASGALYGVTRSLFSQLQTGGILTRYADVLDEEEVAAAVATPNARLLYFESIANPLLQVADIPRLTSLAHAAHLPVIVDNTFATPYLSRPLADGVDIVIHSATKYIAGHGDVIAGSAAGSRSWMNRLRARRTVQGAVLSPFDAWLTIRGIRTLPLRMQRQCETASELARWLERQPWTERVYYPGLVDDPARDVAARQFRNRFGAMVAVDLRAGRSATLAFMDALELIVPGTSLGDVISLALYPAMSSHRTLTAGERAEAGIGEGLVRLSIGLESARDLERDLGRAAQAAGIAPVTGAAGHPGT